MARLLDKMRKLLVIVPEVKAPTRQITFRERIVWTVVCLLLFLICSQVPLYGITSIGGSDPLYWMRLILASSRGSLTELGITPTVSSSTVMQLLAGVNLIDVNMSLKNDRAVFNGVQKLLAIVIALGQAVVSVWSGVYGPTSQMSYFVMFLLVAQLMIASVITTLLDDIISKGYGIGSGISLFIATNICEGIVWRFFSPTTISTARGTEFEGAVVSMFHLLLTRRNKFQALKHAFFRKGLPNMSSVVSTLGVLVLVVYLQGFRVTLNLKSTTYRGQHANYSIKLFYTSNVPITLYSALISNFFFISQILYRRWPKNFFIRCLGRWGDDSGTVFNRPLSGFAYYLLPPDSLSSAIKSPLSFAIYFIIIVTSCSLLSYMWCEASGASARVVAKQLKSKGYVISSTEGSTYKELKHLIPTAAVLGGIFIAGLSIFADLLDAIGSGTGILIAVTIIYQYIGMLSKGVAEPEYY